MHTDPTVPTLRTADRAPDRDQRPSAAADRAGGKAFADMLSNDAVETPAKDDAPRADVLRSRRPEREHEAKPRDFSDETVEAAQAEAEPDAPAAAPPATPPSPVAEAVPPAGPGGEPRSLPSPSGAASSAAALPPGDMATKPAMPPPLPASSGGNAAAATGLAAAPSTQANDLARVLAPGTQVQVTQADPGPRGSITPLGGESIAILASGLASGEDRQAAIARGQAAQLAGLATRARPGATDKAETAPAEAGRVISGPGIVLNGGWRPSLSGPPGEHRDGAANASSPGTQTAADMATTTPLAGGSLLSAPAASGPASAIANGGDRAGPGTQPDVAGPKPPSVQAADQQAVAPPQPPQMTPVPHTPLAGSLRVPGGDAAALPPPAGQVSVHIAKAVQAGLDRIDIQLSPASLGRVDIRLDIADRHHVKVVIRADSSDALDALRTDSRLLERALHDAGLKTDAGSLSFHLRDHGARSGPGGHGGRGDGRAHALPDTAGTAEPEPALMQPPPLLRQAGGIDIRA